MSELLSLEQLQAIAHQYGYWAVFLGITLENMGIPLPGETITIIGGFLCGSGELNYWLVLPCAIGGAVLGDNFGYWIGRNAGWDFLVRVGQFFRISENKLVKVREEFGKNAPKAVFFGRFVTLLRIFAGPLAGIAQMPYGQFFVYNLGGAALWASIMVTLSYFLGKVFPLKTIVTYIAQFGLLALAVVIASIIIPLWWESRESKKSNTSG